MTLSRRNLLGAALSLPVLAACGSTAAEAGGRKKVRLTYGVISVPKTRGVFEKTLKDQGIDVEWVGPFPNHAPTLQAVATGTADFSFGGSSTPADQALLSGNKLTYVAWAKTTPRLSSILVLPNSGITSVKDLAGRNVAVNKAGLGEFLLVAALEKYGVPRESVTFTYLNPPDAAPAFGSGKVDAWGIWSGPMELAEVQYGAKRLFTDGKELDRQIDFSTYLVREDYARKEADTIRKVIAAYKAEADWANANQAEAQKIGNEVSRYPQPVVDKIVEQNVQTTWSLINDEGIAALQAGADWLSERKVLSGKIDIAEHAVKL
ncbi:aliphatic sulfonate ABC transporter substrate-binding protein [Couchioplanes caeruleus]|uniref:aliphatic sulfonate ABC transporter substrate-binding protein n=1 Tax=Couchioplanes caeruleus TaxID=56438 RepID=UPI00201BB633|nr:aliphatic sulfonate ABC transporter substrate-binding protein [Couchioplanes caeruleus]UQU66750.1 aliphatic sulfonate ABC transporter substrate-binding protein [Couchioplanes caeruleus]